MESNPSLHEIYAGLFIDHCKDKFGWQDLTSDVIMDIGLGEKGNCGKAILAKFPDVTSIIGVDGNPQVLHKFKQESQTKIQCVVADIEKRVITRRICTRVDLEQINTKKWLKR
ncbi:unnamed protein product [Larinioides sclopetarius]|uniref:Uncharacterized protein n=1 Tax=Larinioides sclopetarius TaxID=280406 RepID=A0AAV2BAV5_9ARAC